MAYLKIKVQDHFSDVLKRKLEAAGPRVAHAMANIIADDTEPFVPARNKVLVNSSGVVENMIIYPGPYARYLYEGKIMVFEEPPYLRTINGKQVLSHYGQRKVPTDKPLDIRKFPHKDATDHWLEASKIKNLDKWTRTAGRLVKDELED